MSTTETLAAEAEQAIQTYEDACHALTDRLDDLQALQRERPRQKLEALVRLCQTQHPASPKVFSISQAEDIIAIDPEYSAYREKVVVAENAVREAQDNQAVARLLAELRLEQFKVDGGLR